MKTLSLSCVCILLLQLVSASLIPVNAAASTELDIILILDNSGSMKKNDPQFLAKDAVTQFVENSSEDARIGVVIFDQDVHLRVPLTPALAENHARILASLDSIDYRGLYTNSPAAVERAIYELRINGRAEADKIAIFMTDGIVDTGDTAADLVSAKWMREDLAAEAAEHEVKIFGIAFTENANFQLIQSLARRTGARYFRATTADQLVDVFDRIQDVIDEAAEQAAFEAEAVEALEVIEESVESSLPPEPAEPVTEIVLEELEQAPELPPEPEQEQMSVATETSEIATAVDAEPTPSDTATATLPESAAQAERINEQPAPPAQGLSEMWMLIVGGGTVVVLFGLLLIVRAFRTGPTDAAAPAAGPRQAEAFLRDMSNISGQERYDITAGFVMVGRIASGLSGD